MTLGEGGFGGDGPDGSGLLAGAGGHDEDGGADADGGKPGTVELGLWPTTSMEGDSGAVLSAAAALSAGSQVLPLYERWDVLSGATGSPRAVPWARLDAMIQPFRDLGRGVALCVGVVDRREPAWPFDGDLASPRARAAIERTIDEAFARYADQLSHLCLGYEIDRYLAEASSSEQTRLLDFLVHAVAYADHHPARRAGTAVGVAITLDAAADADALEELAFGDEVVAVYDPLDARARLKPPAAIADELAAAVDALAEHAGGRPLTLMEAGYPSSAEVGASQANQALFYDALFSALEPRSEQVAFVGGYGLQDRMTADCEAEAPVFGGSPDERALVRCSMGLRAESGAPKLAWPELLRAFSRYR